MNLRGAVSSVASVPSSGSQHILGADLDDLERCATYLANAATRLVGIQALLAVQIRSSTWTGAAAVRFGSEWRNSHEPSLRLAAATLRFSGEHLRTQAEQQRCASSSDAGSSPAGSTHARSTHAGSSPAGSSPAGTAQWLPIEAGHPEALQSLYHTNQVAIMNELQLLRAQRAEWLQVPVLGGLLSGMRFLPFDPLEEIDNKVGWLQSLVGKDRQFLFVDTLGSGHAAEVFGNLDQASHVAVVIPGVSTDLGNFIHPDRLPAAVLQRGVANTAVVQWLGYDPPDNMMLAGVNGGANSRIAAQEGAVALQGFVVSLRAAGAQDITVIGHSLGAYLASIAAGTTKGLAADRVVFAGSPGSFRSDVEQFHLQGGQGSESTVFVIEQGADPVAAGAFGRSLLGSDVTDPGFGATRLLDGQPGLGSPLSNHSNYFSDTVSVQSMQRVITQQN